jgi:hypothetical protein
MDRAALIPTLRAWRQSSFRLEALDYYAVEYEEHLLGAYLRGEPVRPFDQGLQEWLERLREERGQSKERVRVHAIGGPLTPYLHYEIEWAYTACADAGEDIRILHRESWDSTPFAKRPPDFYVLDGSAVVLMTYDYAGHWLGGEVITDPADVGGYLELRGQALAAAVPLHQYLAAVRHMACPPPVIQPVALRISS